jgi:hypothetical protein
MAAHVAFRKGQIIWVEVIEIQAGEQLLVSYEGQLIPVQNSTSRRWNRGDRLKLSVYNLNPIEFRIYSRPAASLDRFI